MATKALTITVELSDSELEEITSIADSRDLSIESLLIEAITDKFDLTGE